MPDHELLRLHATWSLRIRGEVVSATLQKQSIESSQEGKKGRVVSYESREKGRGYLVPRPWIRIYIYLDHGAFKDMHSRRREKQEWPLGVCLCVCESERGETKDHALFTSFK